MNDEFKISFRKAKKSYLISLIAFYFSAIFSIYCLSNGRWLLCFLFSFAAFALHGIVSIAHNSYDKLLEIKLNHDEQGGDA